jgi:hypothetical protein
METFKFTLLKNTLFVTRLTRLEPLVVQELPTLPENLSSLPVFSGVRVARSLPLCVSRKQTPRNRILCTIRFALYRITQTGTIQC